MNDAELAEALRCQRNVARLRLSLMEMMETLTATLEDRPVAPELRKAAWIRAVKTLADTEPPPPQP